MHLPVAALSLLALLPGIAATTDAAERPNIIYINADDLGWAELSYQGSTYHQSPNIDRMAAEGMVFSNAYAPASNCAPSRAGCMSGLYAPRHGVYTVANSDRGKSEHRKLIPIQNTVELHDDHVTIAEALKASGYITAHMGKWHLGADPCTQGFDINIAGYESGGPRRGGYHSPYDYPNCIQTEPGEYLTDRLGAEAVQFIINHQDQPFFLHFATYSVHTPIQPKPELESIYQQRTPTAAHDDPAYAAMIHSFDENVGRILATIDELGLANKTLILLSSDNGGSAKISPQWPLRAGKGSYYEGGIREPMIFRWPGTIEPGSTCDTPVIGIDFFPTFLEAAGIDPATQPQLDGASLMPLLRQSGGIEDRALFWHFPIYLQCAAPMVKLDESKIETRDRYFRTRPGSALRYGDWKFHEYFEDGSVELFHVTNDIGEKNNLADQHPEVVADFQARLQAWRTATNAPVPTALNPEYKP